MREYISEKDRAFPGLILLLGLINGTLAACLMPGISWLETLLWMVPGILLVLFSGNWRILLKFALLTLLGFASVSWQLHLPEKHYEKALPPAAACGASLELMITDSACAGPVADWLPSPNLIEARVLNIRFGDCDEWREAQGKLLLRLPIESPRVQYGNRVRVQGSFVLPDPPLFEGAFDFQRYLRAQGVRRIFEAENAELFAKPGRFSSEGIFRAILDCRDTLMARMSDGISELSNKRMLGALVFGTRQGLEMETRQAFVRSGTVHILTVSGFHVGLLAVIFLWLLRPLPFRARYLLLPLIVLIYVLTTGMQPPAVRALVMISVWALHRAFLWSPSALNVVFLSAALIIAWNPFVMLDMGFQYSFTCVFFLLASWQGLRPWIEGLGERMKWVPAGMLGFREIIGNRIAVKIFAAVASCVVAWLASYGITLFYQGLYVPMAVPANLVVLPVAWLLFLFATLKFFLLPFAALSFLCGNILEYLLDAMTAVCGLFAGTHGKFAGTPPLWTLPFFYAALLALVVSKRRLVFSGAAAILAAVLVFWHLAPLRPEASVAVFLGGRSQEPAIVLCEFSSGRATLVNAPSFEAARGIMNYLSSRGVSSIDSVLVARGRRTCYDGAKTLLASFPLGQIVMPSDALRYPHAQELSAKALEAGTAFVAVKQSKRIWDFAQGGISARSAEGEFSLELKSGGGTYSLRILDDGLGEHKILFGTDSATMREYTVSNSNNLSFAEFPLPRRSQ